VPVHNPTAPAGARNAAAALAAAVLGFFVVTLDAVVVNVALPSIGRNVGGGMTGLQWVVDGYTLLFAALLLSAGALSDRVGARRAFGVGVGLFGVASIACGLAPTIGALVGARFVQGSAAAVIMPASMALIGQAYADPVRRARAAGVWAMGGAIASSCGPVLGGLLTLVSWRAIFFLNVPAVALAFVLLARTAPSAGHRVAFDWAGQLTAVVAMGGLTYGAIAGGAAGFGAVQVLLAFAVAAAAFVAFVLVQRRSAHPMVPPALFRSRNVSISAAVGFAFVVGYYGLPFVMSLGLQQQRGLSSAGTGVVFLPMMLIGLVLTPFSVRFAERAGARLLTVGGLVVMTAGLVALAAMPAAAPVWLLAVLMLLVGLGGPLVTPPLTGVLLTSTPRHLAGTASGVFNTSRQVGGALAIAVFGVLLTNQASFHQGLQISLLVAAVVALAAAGAAAALTAPPRPGWDHSRVRQDIAGSAPTASTALEPHEV
jgi:MFS transporter, DHA2 family, methylenomycin A resistance protein